MEQYFTFVKNDRLYKHEELFKIFEQSECDVALIDVKSKVATALPNVVVAIGSNVAPAGIMLP